MPQRYDYRVLQNVPYYQLEDELNQQSDEGWRLITILHTRLSR